MVTLGASLFPFRMATFFLCPHMTFSLWPCIPDTSSSAYKDSSSIRLESHSYYSLNLIFSFKFLSSSAVTLRARASKCEFRRYKIKSITIGFIFFSEKEKILAPRRRAKLPQVPKAYHYVYNRFISVISF